MAAIRIILAGGGTSGHVNPALAIADQLKVFEPDAEILFCGTKTGIESEMVPRAGYQFESIEARGLPTRLNRQTIEAVRAFFRGRRQCRTLIREFKPDIVVGTGGYVCSPLIAAAVQSHIPALLHEQNAYPGRSNRLLAGRCQAVCISFAGTEKYFRTKAAIVLTGNPVRREYFQLSRQAARQKLAIADRTRLILVMGGSLGASSLNRAVMGLGDSRVWQQFITEHAETRMVLAAGRQHHQTLLDDQAVRLDTDKEPTFFRNLDIQPYLYDAPLWMAAADLVIARAGAMTCAELAALGRASILVPYPYAAGDHQTFNARTLADKNAAVLLADDACTAERLAQELSMLLDDPAGLAQMGRNAASLARPDAAADIVRCLQSLLP